MRMELNEVSISIREIKYEVNYRERKREMNEEYIFMYVYD